MQHGMDSVIDKIIIARVGLLLRHPFFGNMATRLKIIDASNWCQTAATDGRALYYNREFFESLTTKNVEFVVAHEILHNVFDHMGRCESRNSQVYNIAADYCVNGQLIRDKIGDQPPKIQIFHDPTHYGKSAEQIYDELMEKYDEEQLKALGKLLDEHIDWGEKGEGEGKGDRPHYTKDELKQIRDEIREATMQAANAAGSGNTPASVARLIKDLTESKINWRQMLRQQIQSLVKNDYSFQRPNRKSWHTGAILPGLKNDETIDICVGMDMSGSVTNNMAKDFLSEIKGIMDEYKDFKIKVWCFDTKVYNEADFDSYNDDIMSYELKGGGGTDFEINYSYMREMDINPKKFIMFTDGYPHGSWGDEVYCDTLFILHGTTSIVPPFGTYAYYEEEARG
jgi:predicted metal-dependent peptidase